jgi:orotidine 5'-phosphate decarboxylase subfamily 2
MAHSTAPIPSPAKSAPKIPLIRAPLNTAATTERTLIVLGTRSALDSLQMLLPSVSLQMEASARFCRGIVDAVAPYVVGVKPQLAFFEALGAEGVRALEEVCAYGRSAGLLVVADGKRGDIGSTARAYASGPSPSYTRLRSSAYPDDAAPSREAPTFS